VPVSLLHLWSRPNILLANQARVCQQPSRILVKPRPLLIRTGQHLRKVRDASSLGIDREPEKYQAVQ